MSIEKPLIVDWKGLKRMGWPYSRTQTGRMMFDPSYAERRFPACRKLGSHRNSHPVWLVSEVLAYFEAHGLRVPTAALRATCEASFRRQCWSNSPSGRSRPSRGCRRLTTSASLSAIERCLPSRVKIACSLPRRCRRRPKPRFCADRRLNPRPSPAPPNRSLRLRTIRESQQIRGECKYFR
jgi:hypothetical protein